MKKILDALDRFEQAAIDKSWMGSKEPILHEPIKQEYSVAKTVLLELIRKKCKGR